MAKDPTTEQQRNRLDHSRRSAAGGLMTLLSATRIVRTLGLYHSLHWLMGRTHVGTPAAKVEADMRRRLEASRKKPIGPDAARIGFDVCAEACIMYVLALHRHNGRTYRRVVRGGF